MADEIATNFLSSMKAKGRKAMDWFKSIARKAQRAAMPAAQGRGKIDSRFTLKLSYNIITNFRPAIPCIKRYLYTQVRGRGFYGITGEDWSYAAALPLQSFQKASTRTVWRDSKRMY